MEALLFRTGSGSTPAVQAPLLPASPRHSAASSVSMSRRTICRSSSESDVARSEVRTLSKLGSRSFTALPMLERDDCIDHAGGGINNNRNSRGGGRGGNGNGSDDIGAYYRQMIKSDPTNSLLLRNYGKYLHEVQGDVVKAEEYYGRAILAGPGDGELLSLYGKLIWDTHRDDKRAKSYFTQALQASPHDSAVLGSYAHFLWEAEDDDDDDEEMEKASGEQVVVPVAAMVEAF